MKNTVSTSEMKRLINYAIDQNFSLEESGQEPVAISFEASAGIGKTSIIRQIAEERNMGFTKINMAQLEETGDLIGMPQVEYECQVGKVVKNEKGESKLQIMPKTIWLNAKQVESPMAGVKYRQTGKTRMGYAKPAWVPEYNEKGTIVLLDDYVRATPQLLQSCMDLILEQKYISWSLPKKTVIVLTNNPDDGTNNVNSLDEAQRSRFMNFEAGFDVNGWAAWAEKAGIDGRCINFVMSYYDALFSADDQGNRICNPRSFVMFSKMISGIKDWDNAENLAFINTIASGCFKDEGGRFSTMFSSFIRNKMHLLIQPKDMLLGGWDRVHGILENTLYDSTGQYRPDLGSLLEKRFVNYVNAWLSSDEVTPIATVRNRIIDFLENEQKNGKRLFSQDLFYHMIKNITSENKRQTNTLLFEPKIAKVLS